MKRYGYIFPCLYTSGAVNLEFAYSLTTDFFIASFQRFTHVDVKHTMSPRKKTYICYAMAETDPSIQLMCSGKDGYISISQTPSVASVSFVFSNQKKKFTNCLLLHVYSIQNQTSEFKMVHSQKNNEIWIFHKYANLHIVSLNPTKFLNILC